MVAVRTASKGAVNERQDKAPNGRGKGIWPGFNDSIRCHVNFASLPDQRPLTLAFKFYVLRFTHLSSKLQPGSTV
jgi:hypothetical protein